PPSSPGGSWRPTRWPPSPLPHQPCPAPPPPPPARGRRTTPPQKGSPAMTDHTAPVALATALAVPNPDALDDMQPHLAWAALHGIARVHARRWSTAADEHPAAAVVAQAFD